MKDLQTLHDEFFKAADRIGKKSNDVMRWLLKIAQYDHLSSGDLINLQYELLYFEIGPKPWYSGDESHSHDGEIDNLSEEMLPTQDRITQFQEWINTMIESIFEKKTLTFQFSSVRFTLISPDKDRKWKRTLIFDEPRDVIKYNLANLFARHVDYIRKCPGCGVIFLADRVNQEFHSRKCQSRTYMRKIRGISPDRYGKRGRPPGTHNTRNKCNIFAWA